MADKPDFPYPSPFEVIRYILRALDLKYSNKFLDERAHERVFDPRELTAAIQENIYQPIAKHNQKAAKFFADFLHRTLNEYMSMVGVISADGISRSEMIVMLNKGIIKEKICHFYTEIHNNFGGPLPVYLFSSDTSAVRTVFDWLEEKESGWKKYLKLLEEKDRKEKQDRISAWKRGDELPSSQSINLLQKGLEKSVSSEINGGMVSVLLFISRAIDFIARSSNGTELLDEVRVSFWGARSSFNIEKEIEKLQLREKQKISELLPAIAFLQHGLKRTEKKDNADQLMEILNFVRKEIQGNPVSFTTEYWLDWHEARWWVFSGNLENANALYKFAFEDALFKSGKNQKLILEEAIVVAASLQKPDRVFLKHLKWVLINFGYDIPSVTDKTPSNKFADTIEDWEVDMWAAKFETIFPSVGWFPGVSYDRRTAKHGPLLVDKSKKIQPDYRNPNREIKIGETWQRKMPQLVWFTQIEDYEACKNLLAKGASVNVASEVGCTPILMALRALDVTDFPPKSLDQRFFDLICNYEHKAEILNLRTQKKRLLPMIAAVYTGQLSVVRKILELGADPNGRGETDEQTALNICIKLIGTLKDPKKAQKNQGDIPVTPEVLDSMRRHAAGWAGFTLDHQMQLLLNNYSDDRYKTFRSTVFQLRNERILEYMNLSSMREIAKLLIERGADVDAEHASPLKGYTPLMLAAELDEHELFEIMLANKGDPRKYYVWPESGEKISCWEIVDYFKSKNVKQLLEDIASPLPAR